MWDEYTKFQNVNVFSADHSSPQPPDCITKALPEKSIFFPTQLYASLSDFFLAVLVAF